MRRGSIPQKLLVSAFDKFHPDGPGKDNVASAAFEKFLVLVQSDELSSEAASQFLADDKRVAAFIEKVRVALAEAEKPYIENIITQFRSLVVELDRKVDEQRKIIDGLKTDHQKSSTQLLQHTDPIANNKSSFWINIRAGAIYFIAGLIVSPVGSILLKRPLDAFDHWFNGPDKPAVAQTAPPVVPKTLPPAITEAEKTDGKSTTLSDPKAARDSIASLQLGDFELYDPATGRAPDFPAKPNALISLIIKRKPASVCQRPLPPIVCAPQPAQPR